MAPNVMADATMPVPAGDRLNSRVTSFRPKARSAEVIGIEEDAAQRDGHDDAGIADGGAATVGQLGPSAAERMVARAGAAAGAAACVAAGDRARSADIIGGD